MGLMSSTFVYNVCHPTAIAWELYSQFIKNHNASLSDSAFTILASSNAQAYQLLDDLKFFDQKLSVFILPSFECDFLKNRGPSLEKRIERIAFYSSYFLKLWKLKPSIYIVIADSFLQKSAHPDFWKRQSIHLKVGDALSRSDLATSLSERGYLSSELVEQATQYAVRGSIIDVFSPLEDYPARIELFEDTVQSIRLFHTDSQRKVSDLSELIIPPAREFLFHQSHEEFLKIRSRIREILDSMDWIKSDREALLSRIEEKSFFPSIDYWAFILDQENFLASPHISRQFRFNWIFEPSKIFSSLKSHEADLLKNFKNSRAQNEWIPPLENFAEDFNAVEDSLKKSLATANFISESQLVPGLLIPKNQTMGHYDSHQRLVQQFQGSLQQNGEAPLKELAYEFKQWQEKGFKILYICGSQSQLERIQFLLKPYFISLEIVSSFQEAWKSSNTTLAVLGNLLEGFTDTKNKFVFFIDDEVFGARKKRSSSKNRVGRAPLFHDALSLLDLKAGDLVVSKENGVGRFVGLKAMNLDGIATELFEIEYRDGAKLFVPVTRLSSIQKHSSVADSTTLDRLGGSTWEQKKSRVKKHLQSLAGELLHLYSLRAMSKGPEIRAPEKNIYEFASTFAFEETPDQEKAINETLEDLKGPKPMDRLICGDVGYGKTEVAIRAAHAAICAGFQVAVLCPTTILAAQHEQNFRKRFAPMGIVVEGASRFKSTSEIRKTFERLREKKCDIVVGTHKLLSQDLGFANLGLLVIDEEQRFGVAHKEKIKKLRAFVHVLSMTATPIPRTLNMAMGGLKDLSIITTAPSNRLSVRTHVSRKKSELIKEAIELELKRGGQVYYVHNRVQTISKELELLRSLLPKTCDISVVHGQMNEGDIEKRMIDFYEGRTQVLIATSIIESGLDVPNANTLFVDRADMFGLAQLYQIRGRVGRSHQRAFAYFLIPEKGAITQDAEERLSVLEAYQELGSGFHIASHDLEIRGSGDILGREQSGQMSSIGFDAYMELLQECIAEIKGEPLQTKIDPEIQIGVDTSIPDFYIPTFGLRLVFYRRLAAASDEHEVEEISEELLDRFGGFPSSVKNLIHLMRIKCQLRRLGVKALSAGKNGYSVSFDTSTQVNPSIMVKAVQKYPTHFQLNPEGRLLIRKKDGELNAERIMRGIEGALSEVESWIE